MKYSTGALWGAFTSLAVISFSFFGENIAHLPNLPYAIFEWLVRVLPGPIVSFSIDLLVRLVRVVNLGSTATVAKQAETWMAIGLFIVIGALFGLFLVLIGRSNPTHLIRYGIETSLALWLVFFLIVVYLDYGQINLIPVAVWLAFLMVAWGAVLGRLLRDSVLPVGQPLAAATGLGPTGAPIRNPAAPERGMTRRTFIYLVIAGTLTAVLSALRIQYAQNQGSTAQVTQPPEPTLDATLTSGGAVSPPEATLSARLEPAPGTRPELTSTANFYRVDINLAPPQVDASTWNLQVDGLVDHPLNLTLDEIRARPSVTQAITLECISNPVGGDLISTGLYTGIRLKDLMAEAGLKPEVQSVAIYSTDGYYESISIPEIDDERTLLVYDLNQQPLPAAHGYPLRMYIPNRFGMKQPKWITHLQAINTDGAGYWVDRGWSKQAIVQTTSVIDAVDTNQASPPNGLVPTGGIAFAGARGIKQVEIQVDDGSWTPVELRRPPLSPLTWVQWRYNWKAPQGKHTLRVRATDGTGAVQTAQQSPPLPDGATGLFEQSAVIF